MGDTGGHVSSVIGALAERRSDVVALWADLGADGPTLGSRDTGSTDEVLRRYLVPLAGVWSGALRGSSNHRAVYLDERLRYIDPSLTAAERADLLRPRLAREFSSIASLFHDDDTRRIIEASLWDLHGPLLEAAVPVRRLLLVGDCVQVETRAFLEPSMRNRGAPVEVRHVFFSAGQPVPGTASLIAEEVRRMSPDLVGISMFTFEGVPPFRDAWRLAGRFGSSVDVDRVADGLVEMLGQVIADIRAVSDVTVMVHSPLGLPLGRWRRRLPLLPAHSATQRALITSLGTRIADLVDGTENTVVLDERSTLTDLGGIRPASQPLFEPADVPAGYFHTTRLGPALARRYEEVLDDHLLFGRAKAVFVDFDHTLWSGVMAEGPVTHDVELQRTLKRLKDAGVLLVALSKNDPASIRWEEMELAESDFVLTRINWDHKPGNALSAIDELDLAPEAFVLLDDNPVERTLVTEHVPGVTAVDPADPATRRGLTSWFEFPSTTLTEESRRRTEMYREAANRRKAMGQSLDYPAMMKGLGLRYFVRIAQLRDIERIRELIQRTNQFNTTTRRLGVDEIQRLVGDPATLVVTGGLSDRFGDLGVVAVAVIDREHRTVDQVVMSCRAMGFGVELALVNRALAMLGGAQPVTGRFVPTERNTPAADLFPRCGFVLDGDVWTWNPGVDLLVPVPEWLTEDTA